MNGRIHINPVELKKNILRCFLVLALMLNFSCGDSEKKSDEERLIDAIRDSVSDKKRILTHIRYDTLFADRAYIGMSMQRFRIAYAYLQLSTEDLSTYDISVQGNGILLRNSDEPMLLVWSSLKNDTIDGILILSDEIIIDSNIRVGMSALDFLKKFNSTVFRIDSLHSDIEYADAPDSLNYRIEFYSSEKRRVGNYKSKTDRNSFHHLNRPDARVNRVRLGN